MSASCSWSAQSGKHAHLVLDQTQTLVERVVDLDPAIETCQQNAACRVLLEALGNGKLDLASAGLGRVFLGGLIEHTLNELHICRTGSDGDFGFHELQKTLQDQLLEQRRVGRLILCHRGEVAARRFEELLQV